MKTISETLLRNNILRLLTERRISKHELALGIGMDDANFGKMLNGIRPFGYDKVDQIAAYFEIEIAQLFQRDILTKHRNKTTTIIAFTTNNPITENTLRKILNQLDTQL